MDIRKFTKELIQKKMITSRLAPVRIELENDGFKFKDVFCWDIEGIVILFWLI